VTVGEAAMESEMRLFIGSESDARVLRRFVSLEPYSSPENTRWVKPRLLS
jgi:hypothetical protein